MHNPHPKIVFVSYGDILYENGYKTRLFGEMQLVSRWDDFDKYLISFEKPASYQANFLRLKNLTHELMAQGIVPKIVPRQNNYQWDFHRDVAKLRELLTEIGFRHGVLHGQSVYGTYLALAMKKHFACRVIFDMHGLVGPEWAAMGKSWFKKIPNQWLERRCLAGADYILAASSALENKVRDVNSKTNVATLPCLVSESFAADESKRIISQRPIGVYLGGAQNWQGIAQVINFTRANNTFLLVVSGDKAEFTRLLADLPENQYKIIESDHANVAKYLCSADFGFLLRDKNELNEIAFPTKLAEYLICGLPVIHNGTIAAVREIVDRNRFGVNIEKKSFQRWWIKWTKQKTENRGQIQKYARKYLTWSTVESQLRSIYRDLATRRILYLLTTASWGGAQRYVVDLAQNYRRQGDWITVGFGPTASDRRLLKTLKKADINTLLLPNLVRPLSLRQDWRAFWDIYKEIKSGNYDVLHANSSKAGILGRLAAWLNGTRKIYYTAHGWAFNEEIGWPARQFYWWSEWLAAFLTTRIFCVSRYDREIADRTGLCAPAKLKLIYNGIDLDTKTEGGGHYSRQIALWRRSGYKVIGTASKSSVYQNNLNLFVEVAGELVKTDPNLRFVVFGELTGREQINKLAGELGLTGKILLTGRLNEPLAIMKLFDVLVLISKKEGFPYVLLEAGAMKVRVVASKVGGVPELIINKKTGLLVNNNTKDKFVETIQLAINNEQLTDKMKRNLYRRIKEDFGLRRMLEKYGEEY